MRRQSLPYITVYDTLCITVCCCLHNRHLVCFTACTICAMSCMWRYLPPHRPIGNPLLCICMYKMISTRVNKSVCSTLSVINAVVAANQHYLGNAINNRNYYLEFLPEFDPQAYSFWCWIIANSVYRLQQLKCKVAVRFQNRWKRVVKEKILLQLVYTLIIHSNAEDSCAALSNDSIASQIGDPNVLCCRITTLAKMRTTFAACRLGMVITRMWAKTSLSLANKCMQ